MSYNLARMAGLRKGKSRLFPVMVESFAMEKEYLLLLRRLLRGIKTGVDTLVIPHYAPLTDGLTTDAVAFEKFNAYVQWMLKRTLLPLQALLDLERKKHTKRFAAAAKRAFEVDVRGVMSKELLDDYMEVVTVRNVGLIKGLADDTTKKLTVAVTNATIAGSPLKELREEIEHVMAVSGSRAKLIARDQTAKFNSDLNKKRHLEAGIDEYLWLTSRDEKVRTLHKRLNGTQYAYGKATGAEDGLPPGQPVQCRCVARGVVQL